MRGEAVVAAVLTADRDLDQLLLERRQRRPVDNLREGAARLDRRGAARQDAEEIWQRAAKRVLHGGRDFARAFRSRGRVVNRKAFARLDISLLCSFGAREQSARLSGRRRGAVDSYLTVDSIELGADPANSPAGSKS